MKKLFLPAIFIIIATGCVKDAREFIPEKLFVIKVKDKLLDAANLIADNETFTVTIEPEPGTLIDDDKVITITVSDGFVGTVVNTASTSATTTLKLVGGRSSFQFNPGKKAKASATLSATVEGATQLFNYTIKPSEPSSIQLNWNPVNPKTSQDVVVTATLIGSGPPKPSMDLKVEFSATVKSGAITADFAVPRYFYSVETGTGLNATITATGNIITNRKPGTIAITASYKAESGIISETRQIIYED